MSNVVDGAEQRWMSLDYMNRTTEYFRLLSHAKALEATLKGATIITAEVERRVSGYREALECVVEDSSDETMVRIARQALAKGANNETRQ